MFKKIAKGLLSLILTIIIGGLSILEIAIEVVYQIIRLVKRGYGYLLEVFLKMVEPIYIGKLRIKIKRKQIKETDDIKFYEFDYETEES